LPHHNILHLGRLILTVSASFSEFCLIEWECRNYSNFSHVWFLYSGTCSMGA